MILHYIITYRNYFLFVRLFACLFVLKIISFTTANNFIVAANNFIVDGQLLFSGNRENAEQKKTNRNYLNPDQ